MKETDRKYLALVVDDDPENCAILTRRLASRGFKTEAARSAADAAKMVLLRKPDVILLDISMPGVSGLDYLKTLREEPATSAIPVIMVSALADTNDIVTALRLGANDYVTKPVNVDVLHARMDTHLKMAEAVRMIRAQRDMLSALAAIDGLTGVYNRRTLDARLEEEIVRTRRYSHPLSALFMDLDHFKAVNDRLGHPAGDEALRLFAARAQDMLRASDALFRYGGEEFFALLPETKIDDALEVAERIRGSLETTPIPLAGIPTTLTVSIGVAELPAGFQGLAQDFVQLADKAMYEAKQAGRNCVRVAPIPPATGGSEGR